MAKSDKWENAILEYIRGTSTFPNGVTAAPGAGSGYWLALGKDTTTPDDTGNFTEQSGDGYSRVQMTTTNMNAPSAGSMTNAAAPGGDLSFGTSSATWSGIKFVGIFDAATGGNLLYYKELATTYNIASGKNVKFAGGTLTIVED